MVIVWGTPESLDGCKVQNDLVWDQCLKSCLTTENCVMVVLDGSEICNVCPFQKTMSSVQKTTQEDKVKVAFKVQIDGPSETCPDGENPPTYNNVQAKGDASTTTDDGKIQNYTISFTGSGWELQTFSMARCIPGYAFYRRPNIDWCNAVGYTRDKNISYSGITGVCEKYGSGVILSGLASVEEVEGIVHQIGKLRDRLKMNNFPVRADAKRTIECQETPTTAACTSIEGFTTVDKTVQNFDAYQFMTDASAGATTGKHCMVMLGDKINDGKVDFVECEENFEYSIWGTICGHEAYS